MWARNTSKAVLQCSATAEQTRMVPNSGTTKGITPIQSNFSTCLEHVHKVLMQWLHNGHSASQRFSHKINDAGFDAPCNGEHRLRILTHLQMDLFLLH